MAFTPQSQFDLAMVMLTMDVYHRDAVGGLVDVLQGHATSIDDATPLSVSNLPDIGFFAKAYTLNGATIISYRGTDDGSLTHPQNLLPDLIYG